jgi:hypothetical protein
MSLLLLKPAACISFSGPTDACSWNTEQQMREWFRPCGFPGRYSAPLEVCDFASFGVA